MVGLAIWNRLVGNSLFRLAQLPNIMNLPKHTLYTNKGNFRGYKILITARVNGVTLDVPDFTVGEDNLTESFIEMSPLGKLPVLATPLGALWESNSILKYLAELRRDTQLAGVNFYEQALVSLSEV